MDNYNLESANKNFNLADRDGDEELNMGELEEALSKMHMYVTPHEVKCVMEKFGDRDLKTLNFPQYLLMLHSAHKIQHMRKFFDEADEENTGQVFKFQVHTILQRLGAEFSSEVATKIMNRFSHLNNNNVVDFETFCLFISALVVFLYHKGPTKRVTVSPAGWNETVMVIHSVMGVVLTNILVFFPLKKEADAASKISMLFVSNPMKNLKAIAYDLAMLVPAIGWAGFFILAFLSRGYFTGKVMDCLSIAFGSVLLGCLMYYVIGGPGTILVVSGCLAIAAGLFAMRNW
ncbi:unnamed protein product [Microthlaspi erraticum]|uniref:EF-hand domain-containing protein n=1 Tax=Microthlaspi erraticum TaxID=1685480 RepID=A0A6D2IRA6_9BRAS|nr:unnamed protein product [Microthlaspi erraticum]CAA7029040.1 unnamed protein product [Microthlaspi erraticum]